MPASFGKLIYGPDGIDFDAPVVQIAGVPGQPEFHRRALREVAISDALHPPPDDPPPRVICLVR